MLYTELTIKAMQFMCEKHKYQVDKSGLPYILHPFHVAEAFNNEISTCAALLHDTLEDTDTTYSELKRYFPNEICNIVEILTRRKGEKYTDYIERVKQNEIARAIKIEDLKHNMDEERLKSCLMSDENRESIKKRYIKAMQILST